VRISVKKKIIRNDFRAFSRILRFDAMFAVNQARDLGQGFKSPISANFSRLLKQRTAREGIDDLLGAPPDRESLGKGLMICSELRQIAFFTITERILAR